MRFRTIFVPFFRKGMVSIFSLIVSGVSLPALAATATDSFQVTATVNAECSVTASDLAFGVYSLTSPTPTDATSSINVTCTNGTSYTVSLNGGGEGSISGRKMSGTGVPSNKLDYQMYTNAGRTTVWGDGVTGSTAAGTGSGASQALTVYGRIPASQAVAPDSYVDTVTVTVTY